ncbi:MAG TPA: tripartite tricarboxylate transporter TctB family protein [Trinickia sp.]|uniref:tripartite tricarboxylate transporter TctB family protein n=1 Tax=Trinickia sp. TaxID=2571163 RepID=UPI002BD5C4EE|nr:tripartite tricarboxylate transporter TctB family protein [Trinickia sp.]HVW52147.1 tripartite tricarboxylate transporter TctB family protein [Trinickia sp.]
MTANAWNKRDIWAGLLLVVLGGAVCYQSRSYGIGTLGQMGPGFFPAALGVLLLIVGALIAVTSKDAAVLTRPSAAAWRGAALVLLSVLAFVAAAAHLGLLPATFSAVAIAGFADRRNSLRDVLVMAGVLTLFCYVVFIWGLHLQLPAFSWEW